MSINGLAPHPAATCPGAAVLSLMGGAACLSLSATFVGLAGVTAGTAALLRCAIASAVLVPMALWGARRQGRPPREIYPMSTAAGVFLGADFAMWTQSILDVGASVATVLINVQVIVLPALSWIVDRATPDRRFMVAAPVMLMGVAMAGGVFGSGTLRGGATTATHSMRGTLLGVAAGVAYAAYLFLDRRFGRRDPRYTVAPVCIATIAAAVTAGLIAAGMTGIDLELGVAAWGWMVALALIGQVTAWLLISSASRRLPAGTVAGLLVLQPVLGVAFGWAVLGERPTTLQLAGASIIVAAVWMATHRPRGSQLGMSARTNR